ncbi:hypothetical protein AVL56_11575 [Alteromonas stellipolaris]|uniref:DUF2513 domain-containing protein n=1 Tax=Alteromonas stellipolaris TaxID=233316 RepID=UPI0007705A3F|nr:DUF2513 domain-containing protein [Alteromonas stellipolaris]AMJ94871.1 hypothetical protein AVL56_11575 [Alteromonas stellipolaris]
MKRNMDLVREILINLNEHPHGYAPDNFKVQGYSQEEVLYHCFILGEAGLIDASNTSSDNSLSPEAIPIRLTWMGHEFIENAKNENIWQQTKDAVHKIGDVSFSVWASVLAKVVEQNLGISS